MMKTIATLLGTAFLLLSSPFLNAQASVCLGTDASVCIGSTIDIVDCTPGGAGPGLVLPAPTTINLSDDQWSGVINLGFTVNFYGVNYTQCTIGSNGVISFNLANAGGYCPWALGGVGTLPNTTFAAARNSMMPAYHDINPAASPGGSIFYQTVGTAPNRRFVVVYKNLSAFGPAGFCVDMAVIVNETSNNIEFHLGYKAMSPTWNGGLAIQGVENAAGTVASITPGRNNSQWTATLDSKIWTPTTPATTTAYTISTIPYLPIINGASGASLMWANTFNSTTWPYNAGTLTVNPILPGVNGYYLVTSLPVACSSNPLIGSSDTTWITGVSSSVSASAVDDICSGGIGSVTATPTSGMAPYLYNWTTLGGANTQTVNGVSAGVHTVVMTDAMGCSSTANVVVGDIPAAFQGSTTVVSCPGGNDGTAYAEMVPVLGNVTYLWDDPAAQTTQTAVGLTAGTYNCIVTSDIGCSGLVTLNVTELPGMIGVITSQTNPTCNSGSNGIIQVNVIQGTAPYTYSWDNSTSTSNIANDLAVGPHTVTVTDFNGCVITISGVLGQPPSLSIATITPDTQICREADILLNVTGAGGSSPYTFTWFENNAQIGTGSSITVDPDVTNTQYCVVLSEACGSPTAQACVLIYFPTDIVPLVSPDQPEKCLPGFFEFSNISGNGAEIASSYFEFGDNYGNALEIGLDTATYTYNKVGVYDVTLTTTSIYGCVYTATMPQLVTVKPNPTADFSFSLNPSDVYNTDIKLQDRSSSDVVNWYWYSAFSNPSTSNLMNPSFDFPQQIGIYPVMLVVETANGCLDTTILNMNIRQDLLVFAPNSFTPNNDEHNQVWKAEFQGIDIYSFELLIFNRWGEVIWQSNDPSVGWDGTYQGKVVMGGTYSWRAKVKDLYTDEKKEFNGAINLLK